jgi:lipid-A-disaccharide synthase
MHIFFSVGEPSGDQHAAHLIEELKRRQPGIEVSGFGGPHMEQAGCRLDYPLTNLAVMGVWAVLPLLWRFYRLVREAGRILRERRPDAVVLVDFPGFNWWIARKAKAAGIPVFYYLPPQLWAWAPWRIRKMQKFVDHVLCALPFEQPWYAERGVNVEYVGHPFFDEVAEYRLDAEFCQSWETADHPVVALLPGSRDGEVRGNWPVMLDVARRLQQRHPSVRFLVACYKPSHREFCAQQMQTLAPSLSADLFVGRTREIIAVADCCLMVSGSVSLELLARATPAVVMYRGSKLFGLLVRLLVTCKYMSLPNLIADRPLMPEFPFDGQPQRVAGELAAILDGWLSDPQALQQAADELANLRDRIVRTGATAHTAEAILNRLPTPLKRAA